MAYKFQIGPAILSGATTYTEALDIQDAFTAQSLSSSGDLDVGGEVQLDGVAAADVAVAQDSFYFLDATDSLMKSESMVDYATAIAGDGLGASSGVLAVSVDDSTIETNGDALRIKDAGVGTAKIADAAIVNDLLGTGSVGTANLIAASVSTAKIADAAIVNDLLATGSVGTANIADDAVTLAKLSALAQGSVIVGGSGDAPSTLNAKTSGQILVGDGSDLASVAVSGDATLAANGALTIADAAVENDMLATGSVGTANLIAASVGTAQIADAAIVNDLLATGSVGTANIADDAVTLAKLSALAQGSVIVGGGSDAPTALNAKTSGQILVGSGTDLASVAVSGDATLAANGALTIANSAVETAMIADANVTTAKIADAAIVNDLLATGSVGTANLAAASVSTAKIADAAIVNDLLATGSVGTANIVDDAVTLAKMAALSQGSVIVGGGSDAPTALDAKTSGQILVGSGTDLASVAVSGDATLAANGALTIANSAVETAMIADANVTTGKLATSAVVGDKIASGSVEHGHLADDIISGQGELSTLADADDMLIHDATDNVVKKVGLDTLATFFRGMDVTTHGNANSTLAEGLNYSTASIASSNKTYTLPASSGLSVGDQVIVKAGAIGSGLRLVVSGAGDQTIDQTTGSVDLLDDGASITLVYAATDKWFIV